MRDRSRCFLFRNQCFLLCWLLSVVWPTNLVLCHINSITVTKMGSVFPNASLVKKVDVWFLAIEVSQLANTMTAEKYLSKCKSVSPFVVVVDTPHLQTQSQYSSRSFTWWWFLFLFFFFSWLLKSSELSLLLEQIAVCAGLLSVWKWIRFVVKFWNSQVWARSL